MTQGKTQGNNKNLLTLPHPTVCFATQTHSSSQRAAVSKAVWPRAQLKDLVTVKSLWLAKPPNLLHTEADHGFCSKRRGIPWQGWCK